MLVSLVHSAVQKLILSTQQKHCIIVQCGRRFKCAFWTVFNILVFRFFVGPNLANPSIPRTPRALTFSLLPEMRWSECSNNNFFSFPSSTHFFDEGEEMSDFLSLPQKGEGKGGEARVKGGKK